MIFTEMFEMVNSQFVFIKTFFVESEVTFIWETWYGTSVACSWTCSVNCYTALSGGKKKSPEVLVIVKGSIVICEKVLWL